MSEKIKLFTKSLKAELEDLEEDIESWSEFLEEKRQAEKVTEYVFMENSSLLRQELMSVKTIVDSLFKVSHPELPSIEAIRDYFLKTLREEVKKFQFPEAIMVFVSRKVEKVYTYLKVE